MSYNIAMFKIIDGKLIAQKIREEITKEVNILKKKGIEPCLKVIIVGENPASVVYVKNKEKDAHEVGFKSQVVRLPQNTTEQEIINIINDINNDKNTHGLLVQLPLPKGINEANILEKINPDKDVDGFHPINIGRLIIGDKAALISCTPAGVMEMLSFEGVTISGKDVVIVGRSNIVGKPLASLFVQMDATVTMCHSKTKNLKDFTKRADILAVAIGRPGFIIGEMVKPGAVVIDVGINNVDGRLKGDVDFESVREVASMLTPVPGGVGPMTRAMLLKNTIKAVKKQNGLL